MARRSLIPSRWRRLLRREGAVDTVNEVIGAALEEQYLVETRHPVPFAPDQRLRATVQRAVRIGARTKVTLPPADDLTAQVRRVLEGAP